MVLWEDFIRENILNSMKVIIFINYIYYLKNFGNIFKEIEGEKI